MWFVPQAFPLIMPRNVPTDAEKLCGAFLIFLITIHQKIKSSFESDKMADS